MSGLETKEPHDGYIGHRTILSQRNHYLDWVPGRGSSYGSPESLARVRKWASTKQRKPPLPGKKRVRLLAPLDQLNDAAKGFWGGGTCDEWELREGNFVLRAATLGSYGYCYIAIYEKTDVS